MQILKYCGMTCEEDYQLVLTSKATHIGFIFAKESKRYVEPEEVRRWVTKFGKGQKKLVGVFVNESMEQVWNTALQVPLDVIQLHGAETIEDVRGLKTQGAAEVWKAIPHSDQTIEKMQEYADVVDAFLIDSKVKGQFGGTGQAFNWGFVPVYQRFAKTAGIPCIIAGGIDADNMVQLSSYGIDGIDVSSGIETNGRKDGEKIQKIEREIPHDISSSR
ncbi:phosphoribosylanthranilate isomerase [Bacillus songklensis]|uniref:N-(5'-phosphoribosyl)anthranilate isomerase n=1 Tax=Bacillus songklensis TaxID=1069116 RepID=A0ABV8AXL1_9BACI